MEADQLWQAALGRIELKLKREDFDTWLEDSQAISYEDGTLIVGVRSAYAKDWLANRLYGDIHRIVSDIADRTCSVRFVVRRNGAHAVSEPSELLGMQEGLQPDAGLSRVNPNNRFDNFIVGSSNRLAHAACMAVAESPATAYNPLFVYGDAGLGKTHLLHAIGNYVAGTNHRILYVSGETFTNDLVNAIRTHTTDEFRATYRTIDVLLLDDVQFLIGKERTQEEFFYTFNDLYQDNRQIVLSSDRPPSAFVGLEERFRSRFEWGLTTDVQPPDLETRMAILVAKAEERGITLPSEVTEFIAQQVHSNIRKLEGALNRVLALARMMGYPLTVQTAQRALSDMLSPSVEVSIEQIMSVVARQYAVSVDDLVGPRRTRAIALPRQIVMYLTREMTDLSFPQIGETLGGRDHTTIMYGYDKIAALFEKDEGMRRQILEVKRILAGHAQAQPVRSSS
ncbi:MAG: chromosomal replication initiator protein DnaA [Anaerolineae bacterium]